ncbi:MAG: hypothetical protein ABR909_00715 [Candidatus Bathyarchaeia archaeon]|jgi:hypothetical protein
MALKVYMIQLDEIIMENFEYHSVSLFSSSLKQIDACLIPTVEDRL